MPVELVAVSFIDGTGKLDHNLKTFYWLSNVLTLSVPDYGFSRNTWCALNLISKFLLLYLVHIALNVLQLHQ